MFVGNHDEGSSDSAAAAAAEVANGVGHHPDTDNEPETSFLNVDSLYATRDISAGEVVFNSEELPDGEVGRSDDPNCEVVDIEDGTGESMAVVTLRFIPAGEFFTVANSDDEDEEESEEEEGDWDEEDDE